METGNSNAFVSFMVALLLYIVLFSIGSLAFGFSFWAMFYGVMIGIIAGLGTVIVGGLN